MAAKKENLQLEYQILPFDQGLELVKSLTLVKEKSQKQSTMECWVSQDLSDKDYPPELIAICLYNNEVVGWAGIGRIGRPDGFFHLNSFVADSYRGKGIAKSLIKLILSTVKHNERNAIVVAYENNAESIIPIIEAFGFESLPLCFKYCYMDDVLYSANPLYNGYHKFMTKPLTDWECDCQYCLARLK